MAYSDKNREMFAGAIEEIKEIETERLKVMQELQKLRSKPRTAQTGGTD